MSTKPTNADLLLQWFERADAWEVIGRTVRMTAKLAQCTAGEACDLLVQQMRSDRQKRLEDLGVRFPFGTNIESMFELMGDAAGIRITSAEAVRRVQR